MEQVARFYSYFQKNHVVFQIHLVGVFEYGVRHEQRASGRDVHRRNRFLETVALRIRSERVRQVSSTAFLVDQYQGHLLLERPRENVVVVALHDDEEEGQMGALPDPVPVQIDASAHLIAVAARVKRLAVER